MFDIRFVDGFKLIFSKLSLWSWCFNLIYTGQMFVIACQALKLSLKSFFFGCWLAFSSCYFMGANFSILICTHMLNRCWCWFFIFYYYFNIPLLWYYSSFWFVRYQFGRILGIGFRRPLAFLGLSFMLG